MNHRFFILFFCFCSIFRAEDFSVISASSEQWWGGKEPAGKGINYDITIKVMKSSEHLQIDQLWIGNKQYDIIISDSVSIGNLTHFNKNDVIHIIAAEKYFKNKEGEWLLKGGLQNIQPPKKYEGVAMIGYKVNNKRKYKDIAKFSEKDAKYLP